jgi:ferredoxin/bacterioferritin-associated ferredoxin
MKLVSYEIEVVDPNCTGCYRCERACPTGAIRMVGPKKEALAVVDNGRCVACMRCIDVCDDDALLAHPRADPVEAGTDFSSSCSDRVAMIDLCREAGIDPEQTVCVCTGTQAQEIAAAVVGGRETFAEVALATGAQSGCLLYCSVPIRRLLAARTGGDAPSASKVKRYDCAQSVLDLPVELDAEYPLFLLSAERRYAETYMEQLEDAE